MVVLAGWGNRVYGEWQVRPDEFDGWVSADEFVGGMERRFPGWKVALVIAPVPVTCEWESDDGSDDVLHGVQRLRVHRRTD